jgi:hypothetical protein
MKRYLTIIAMVLVLSAVAVLSGCQAPLQDKDVRDRAAIVDQLYVLEQNPALINEVTQILESYGFTVDLWQGEQVTVDFYRELPKRGYKLIVLRVHSGLLLTLEESKVKPLENSYLFTGEVYTTTKYVSEQLTDKVSNAMMAEDCPLIFAVNSEFIKDSEGKFDDTVILAMGCESYCYDDMAFAFIEKGASVYVGWSTVVSLEYVDDVTLDLLANLCTKNMTVAQGITETMADLGHDPYFDAYLKYYPGESGDKKIAELIGNK